MHNNEYIAGVTLKTEEAAQNDDYCMYGKQAAGIINKYYTSKINKYCKEVTKS